MIDAQLLKRFKLFQKKTGKYSDFKLDLVEFDYPLIKNIYKSFTKGKTPKYDENNTGIQVIKSGQARGYYNNFDFTKPQYLQVDSYSKEDKKNLIQGDLLINTTGKGTAGRVTFFDLIGKYVADSHISILRFDKSKIDPFYILNFFINFGFSRLESLAEGSGGQVELPLHVIEQFKIPIPKSLNQSYNSLEIQQILVEFIEYYQNETARRLSILNIISNKIIEVETLVLPLFFNKHPSVKKRFNAFCKLKMIDLILEDLKFESKRVHSNNSAELICKKRMGFTPDRSVEGDINWFTVSDLTKNASLYIDNPDTKEKTTMELIKKKVSEKSDKYLPIKKGDVLVSFKLTVGLVKIYNSDLPAYCNEAIDILTPFENIDSRFLAYNCIIEYPQYGEKTNNGLTLNDEHKKSINIRIPKPINDFSSLQIQEIIIEFIESYLKKMNHKRHTANSFRQVFTKHTQLIIQKTFANDKTI